MFSDTVRLSANRSWIGEGAADATSANVTVAVG